MRSCSAAAVADLDDHGRPCRRRRRRRPSRRSRLPRRLRSAVRLAAPRAPATPALRPSRPGRAGGKRDERGERDGLPPAARGSRRRRQLAGPDRAGGWARFESASPCAAGGEVLAVLRGPLPSCDVRAQRRIDAKVGTNAVPLTRVIRPRRAVPGHYLLTVYVDSFPKVRRVVGITRNRAHLLRHRRDRGGVGALHRIVRAWRPRSPMGPTAPPEAAPRLRGAVVVAHAPGSTRWARRRGRGCSRSSTSTPSTACPAIAAVIALALLAVLLAGIGGMAAFFRGRTRSARRSLLSFRGVGHGLRGRSRGRSGRTKGTSARS